LIRRLRDALLVVAVVVPMLAVVGAVFTTRVYGDSMSPTIKDGDALLVDRVALQRRSPRRGDVVLASDGGASLIKRVIAVAGDVIEIDGSGSRPVVLVEPGGAGPWQRLDEPYVGSTWTHKEFCCDSSGVDAGQAPEPLRLPPNRYFLLGDNRDSSTDSRHLGLFSTDQIVGRVVFRWWPLGRAGPIETRPILVATRAPRVRSRPPPPPPG
jgi:signal peptidase I